MQRIETGSIVEKTRVELRQDQKDVGVLILSNSEVYPCLSQSGCKGVSRSWSLSQTFY
jgi:hypothetical protein